MSAQPARLFSHFRRRSTASAQDLGRLRALDRSQAVIEFAPDGTVLDANANFLEAFGCRLDEVKGRHHRMFVDPGIAASPDYAAFWRSLNAGEFMTGQFQRFTPSGREIWLQATYNPVFDEAGRLVRVVKFATDVTTRKTEEADVRGQLDAIDRSPGIGGRGKTAHLGNGRNCVGLVVTSDRGAHRPKLLRRRPWARR